MRSFRLCIFVSVIAVLPTLGGCAETPEAPDSEPMVASNSAPVSDTLGLPPALAGTQWQLIEFQSMDGTSEQPGDSTLYTLHLQQDGRVAMQLNCNRGTGTWSAESGPGVDSEPEAESGSITIGPIATTRALCSPPSMDEQIARDMDLVRGYLLRDGTLSLSLIADGGLYLWEAYEA